MKRINVLYNTTEGVEPTQGYENDFAYDVYASEGSLVPPLTFKSVQISTDLKTAFDPTEAGMKVSLRSGVAAKTPLIVSNTPGIIEGTYRDGIKILVRNTFIDNRLVDFVFNVEGERVPVKEIPEDVMNKALEFYKEETELLGYGDTTPEVKDMVYKTHVPAGTIYVAKHDRIAQMHFQDKITANFINSKTLPKSERGKKGLGSSGTKLNK